MPAAEQAIGPVELDAVRLWSRATSTGVWHFAEGTLPSGYRVTTAGWQTPLIAIGKLVKNARLAQIAGR